MPDFPSRKLSANHGNTRPNRILFYDCETKSQRKGNDEHLKMYLGWTYYARRDIDAELHNGVWKSHSTQLGLCKYIDSMVKEKTCLYICGHNIYFDLQASGFFYYFTKWNWTLEFLYDKGLTYVLIIRNGTRTIKAISTTNYFTESLERLGNSLHIKKTKVSFAKDSRKAISAYCYRDVEIIVAAVAAWLRFIDEHDAGSFGLTRASQAFRAYRHRFIDTPIYIHYSDYIKELERDSYMGGRTEAFNLGKISGGPFVCYDINSMYPFVMREKLFPYQLIDYREDIEPAEIPFMLDSFAMTAECVVNTDVPLYAIRHGEKIVFPVGQFTAYLNSGGLRTAFERGHLVKIRRSAFYRKAQLFKTYIDYFYAIKQKAKQSGDSVTEKLVKVFLNSLYGKFGQKYTETIYEPAPDANGYIRLINIDMVDDTKHTETYLFNTRITEGEETEGKHSFTAIAAHVTEYARLLLYSIIEQVGRDRVIYCDTDSVYIRKSDAHRITFPIHDTDLGALSLEKEYPTLTIHGAKDYEAGNTRKIKGVPKRARRLKDGSWKYQQFSGQATHLREGQSRAFILRTIIKKNKRIYDKGVVSRRGKVTPFVLAEDV